MIDHQSTLGASAPRVDALAKVTGQALYPGDLTREDMLHAKLVFSARTHAYISAIDTTEALALPGVVAVFTAADVPVNEYGLVFYDQPVLCGPNSTSLAATVRTVMDNVAVVVAETAQAAAQAARLIQVTYQDLPAIYDPEAAMQPGAPVLHPDHPDNVIKAYRIRSGTPEAGFAEADVIVEARYTTTWQEHAYLQPEAGLAYIDAEGRITVEVAGQHAHKDRQQIAHALGLPEDQVRVIYPAVGGAFGGREDMSVQIVLALAAWKLRRPVSMVWSRFESLTGHHKRHPVTVEARWGARRDGTLTAAQMRIVGDAGAYNYTSNKVMGNVALMSMGPYHCPNVAIDAYAVYTNNLPSGAFRGFGGPQAAFAAEGQMNRLAAALGLDPVELRLKNTLREGQPTHVGTPLPPGITIDAVMEACALCGDWAGKAGGWPRQGSEQAGPVRRGVGFAAGMKNIGFSFGYPESCAAAIELHGASHIERAVLRHAAAEVGQGVHTVLRQMAAEALGLPLEKIEMELSDTASSDDSGSVSASRMTFMAGNAIIGAARLALQKWAAEDRPAVGEYVYRPPATTTLDPVSGQGRPNFAYGYAAQMVELEVDTQTGVVTVTRVYNASDVGKAINRNLVEGQIEGGIAQAHGYALLEAFHSHEGRPLTRHMGAYLIPSAADVPQAVESIILELGDEEGPFGARGLGEMPYIPYAPAVAAALFDATGAWFDDLPITPERIADKLRQAAG